MTRLAEGGRTDTASRTIAAPPSAIYRAFLAGDSLTAWLPPAGMTGRLEAFDPVAGGRFRIVLAYDDPGPSKPGKTTDATDVVDGRFVELDPDARIVWAVSFDSDDEAFAGEMRMTWSFSPVPGGTEVRVVCENVPEGIRPEDHEVGLQSTLANLAGFVEGLPPRSRVPSR